MFYREQLNYLRKYFAIHDPTKSDFREIRRDKITYWNKRKYGIFKTVNIFHNERQIEQLSSIVALAVELDDGTKDEQMERIIKLPMSPSVLIESKNGYHVYYHLDGNMTVQQYKNVMDNYLIPTLGADPRARDVSRVLRLEGCYHWKDPDDPFLVKVLFEEDIRYQASDFSKYFKSKIKKSNKIGDEETKEFSDFLSQFNNVKRLSNGQYEASCPAPGHKNGDMHPSLHIAQKDGKILVHCKRCDSGGNPVALNYLKENGYWYKDKDSQDEERAFIEDIYKIHDGISQEEAKEKTDKFIRRHGYGRRIISD